MVASLAQPLKPSRTWYVVALVVLGLGAASGAGAYQTFVSIADGLQRAVIPGSTTLRLDEPGTYTLLQESRSVVGGRAYNVPFGAVPAGQVTIFDESTGTQIPVVESTTEIDYSVGDYEGMAIGQFTISAPGSYRLEGAYEQATGPEIVIAVGRGVASGIFRAVGLILGAIGGVVLAGIIALITLIRRASAKRRARAAPPGGYPPWSPPPAPYVPGAGAQYAPPPAPPPPEQPPPGY